MSYIYNLADTWDNAGTVFTAIKMNVTDVASNASSALLDLQVGGVSQFKVSKAGAVTAVGVAIPTISSSDTLSNKTLSSPTLSGTVAGTPTFTGNVVFNATPRLVTFNIGADSDIYVYESATNTLTFRAGGSGTETYLTIKPSNVLELGGVAIPTISSSDTLSNKTLSSPTLSGTVAGGPTFSGLQSYSVGSGTTYAEYSRWIPTDYAAGKPYLYIAKSTVAVRWDIGTWDGVTNANEINFTTPIMYNGVAIPTISSSDTLSNKTLSGVTIANNTNIVLNTTNGTKIGTATSQKLGFFNATPVVQPTAVADATDAASVITQLNALLSRMRDLGLIAT